MDQRFLDYAEVIPTPGPKFNIDQFYAKGASALEDLIGEYLLKRGIKVPGSFDRKIRALKAVPDRAVSNKLVRALHSYRRARNEYLHNTRTTSKGIKIERRFMASIEKACHYTGRKLFPVDCSKNQHQWRLYYAYTVVWENLVRLSKPDDDFYPTREILNGILVQLQQHESVHS